MEGEQRGVGSPVGMASPSGGPLGRIAKAIFPHHCVVCLAEGSILCGACVPAITSPMRGIFVCPGCGAASPLGARCGRRACINDGGVDGVISAAPYAHPALRELLRLHKYERVAEAGEASIMAFRAFVQRHGTVLRALGSGAAVVPVPMHPFRQALRGFNQAEALAACLASAVGRPMRTDVIRRRFRLRAQANVAGEGRRRNAADSVVRGGASLQSVAVLLVDDVVTSGATLDACAAALKSAGAKAVWGITLLRG